MGPKQLKVSSSELATTLSGASETATDTITANGIARRQQLIDAETAAADFSFLEIARKTAIAMISKGLSNSSQNI